MLHKLSFKIKVTMNLYRNQKKVMLTKKPQKNNNSNSNKIKTKKQQSKQKIQQRKQINK